MRLEVRVIPRAPKNLLKKENNLIKVYLTRPAHKGQANAQLIELLSQELKIRKYQIRVLKGQTSRQKIIEIDGEPGFLPT